MTPGPAPGTSLRDVAEGAVQRDGRDDGGSEAPPGTRHHRWRWWPRASARSRATLLVAGLVALLTLPLVVALVVLAHQRWFPLLDMAQTEMRVRAVGTAHPPLIGLPGRIGTLGHQGSHAGPLSFWALWPFYRLFGSTSWALETATVALNVIAIALVLWIAHRRGGIRLALAVSAVLAVLLHAYGPSLLTQGWNPYLPVLWWLVFLFAVWSVVSGDLPLLPVVVLAGFFCMQTHVSYLGLTGGLGLFALASISYRTYTRRRAPGAVRSFVRWTLLGTAIGVMVWIPPVIEQFTRSPGNLSVLRDYFRHPPETPVGLRRGLEVLLVHLNPWTLATKQLVTKHPHTTNGSIIPGLLLLAVFALAVLVAWRLRQRSLLRLQLVLGMSLVLGLVSLSRVFGILWYYLALWAWGVNALMLLAVGWTAVALVGPRLGAATRAKVTRAGVIALAGVAALWTMLFTFHASSVDIPTPRLSKTLGKLVAPTADALARRSGQGAGRNHRYLVTWTDPLAIGSQGFGLMNELQRRGFDVGAEAVFRGAVTPDQVIDPAKAAAVVHLSIGSDIRTWRAKPGVREVAYFDPRSPKERSEYARLRAQVIEKLETAGLSNLVPGVDGNLLTTTLNPRVPKSARDRMLRMSDLGLPAAVFVGSPPSRADIGARTAS